MVIVKRAHKDQVVDYMCIFTFKGNLAPGDQVKEGFLSVEMGITEYRPQAGNFISQHSPQEIVKASSSRMVLQEYAVGITRDLFSEEEISNRCQRIIGALKSSEKSRIEDVICDRYTKTGIQLAAL